VFTFLTVSSNGNLGRRQCFSSRCSVDSREALIDFTPVAAVHVEWVWISESAKGRAFTFTLDLAFTLDLDTQRFLFPVFVEGGPLPEVSGAGREEVSVLLARGNLPSGYGVFVNDGSALGRGEVVYRD
jgi:hypothetical protein